PEVPIEESMGALVELKDDGKIRHIGVSNMSENQLRVAQKVTPVVSIQNRLNVSDRSSETIVDLSEQEDLVFLPWAPMIDAGRVKAVAATAQAHGATEHQIALAWLLARSP